MAIRDPKAASDGWSREASDLLERRRPATTARLFRLIDDGLRLRRTLDQAASQSAGDGREGLRHTLELLQAEELRLIAAGLCDAEAAPRLRALSERRLRSDQEEFARLCTDPETDPVELGVDFRRLRLDLMELGERITWLDGLPAGHAGIKARVELNRLRENIRRLDDRSLTADRAALLAEFRRTRRRLLIHRLDRQLSPRVDLDWPASRLWARRLELTRLRAELVLEINGIPLESTEDRRELLADHLLPAVDDRRAQLAEAAAAAARRVQEAGDGTAWDEVVHEIRGESQEALALAEDLPLEQAVAQLAGTVEDLGRLQSDVVDSLPGLPPLPAARLSRQLRGPRRLRRTLRGEWQEKGLLLRLRRVFGLRMVRAFDALVLVLILSLTGLIVAEAWMESTGRLRPDDVRWFAWADLAICSVFLVEFAVKLALAPAKWLYLARHAIIDLLPSIPFGFLAYQLTASAAVEGIQLLRLLRLPRLVWYIRLARPLVRIGRLFIFFFRFTDQLVRRYGSIFNRNIILFEQAPERENESKLRHDFVELRRRLDRRIDEHEATLAPAERLAYTSQVLQAFRRWVGWFPLRAVSAGPPPRADRDITIERVVERLIEMTPEEISQTSGPDFASAVDRVLRLFDAPVLRRLPVVRELLAHREKGPAESAALAANYAGAFILRLLDRVYFLADLQATVSPPLFLDKLGRAIINATRRPAFRLLTFGLLFLGLWLVGSSMPVMPARGEEGWLRRSVDLVQESIFWVADKLGPPVIALGIVCFLLMLAGQWMRRIANQAAEFSERVVEAQFATQTKELKRQSRDRDRAFIDERVTRPELRLRASDDLTRDAVNRVDVSVDDHGRAREFSLDAEETTFLYILRLLYNDFLDGPPFHRTDTKASSQLLGNLALRNLSRSSLPYLLHEGRRLQRLDLNRAANNLFGGPFLWFDYTLRLIVQYTARLLVDYNRNAVPLDRLACSPRSVRDRYRAWLSRRLGVPEAEIPLPAPVGQLGDAESPQPSRRREEAREFFETVEFTAVDFLAGDPGRDREIGQRFGSRVLELLQSDRQRNLRQAFRSFPLHRAPVSRRTINVFYLYEAFLGRGRVLLLPFRVLWWAIRGLAFLVGRVVRVVREILDPRMTERPSDASADSYAAALRKIHRMRKPAFMESLWMRARFDVEYLGLALPGVPISLSSGSLLEVDLDFIGASRHERVLAGRVREAERARVRRVSSWLHHLGWSGPGLADLLRRDFPHLADRSGEVVRALVAACVVDHDDLFTLGASIDGLRRLFAHAADPSTDLRRLPANLPEAIIPTRLLWHSGPERRRPPSALFALPCFPEYTDAERARILRALRIHRGLARGWVRLVLDQGGDDPIGTLRARMLEVILRADLWSEQLIVLRMVQTLTMLDLQHYAELVWSLGGYESLGDPSRRPSLPFSALDHDAIDGDDAPDAGTPTESIPSSLTTGLA